MGDRRDRGVYRENLNPFPVSGSESPKSKVQSPKILRLKPQVAVLISQSFSASNPLQTLRGSAKTLLSMRIAATGGDAYEIWASLPVTV